MSESTVDDKFDLITKAVMIITEMDSRTGHFKEFGPKRIEIRTFRHDEDFIICEVNLVFSDDRVGNNANWSGMGKTINESLKTVLWSIRFEIEERRNRFDALMIELKEHAPFENE